MVSRDTSVLTSCSHLHLYALKYSRGYGKYNIEPKAAGRRTLFQGRNMTHKKRTQKNASAVGRKLDWMRIIVNPVNGSVVRMDSKRLQDFGASNVMLDEVYGILVVIYAWKFTPREGLASGWLPLFGARHELVGRKESREKEEAEGPKRTKSTRDKTHKKTERGHRKSQRGKRNELRNKENCESPLCSGGPQHEEQQMPQMSKQLRMSGPTLRFGQS